MPGKYTIENLEPIIKASKSWADVCRRVGVKESTGAQTYVTTIAKKLEIDYSHFSSKGWNKGKTYPVKNVQKYLVLNTPYIIASHALKLKLIKAGLKESKCEICARTHWNNEEIVLELDHINSNHFDNRIENLQIVCPNCHAQETRKRRKLKKLADVGELVDPPGLGPGTLKSV